MAFVCFAASIIFAILFILPRKGKYKNLATMKVWQKWRDDYNKYFDQSGGQDKKPNDALLHEITNSEVRQLMPQSMKNADNIFIVVY